MNVSAPPLAHANTQPRRPQPRRGSARMAPSPGFPYDLAFDRNLGWLTAWEQASLRARHVAIAGMGGVGGIHLLTLARLGIGGFTLADFDHFELANFNRQAGATLESLGQPKTAVMAAMAGAINPELRLRRLDGGVSPESVDEFLAGADLFVDGLDFFEIDIRRCVFARARALGIPAVTAAPIGMGVGYLVFTPRGMSFDDYFGFAHCPPEEQALRFLIGLAPRGLHRAYLIDPTRINLPARRGPSTAAAVQLCAGVVGAAAVKLLLGRPGVKPAPWHHHFDAYRDRMAITHLRAGLAGPVQQLKLRLARAAYARAVRAAPPPPDPPEVGRTPLEEILDLARWAPSGDNVQPWRFAILDAATVRVRLAAPLGGNPYEYRGGEPTLLALGMLLETLRIAASGWERSARWEIVAASPSPTLRVTLAPAPGIARDPLLAFVTLRSVDRLAYRRRMLTAAEVAALEAAAGARLRLEWHVARAERLALARLNARATDIRLRAPECFPIHQHMIDWTHAQSPDRMPAAALGLPAAMLPMLRWAMADWARMQRMNRLLGTGGTALQTDILPGLAASAFFLARRPAGAAAPSLAQLLEEGAALQRVWLTATQLGLAMQPTLAMIAFAEHGARDAAFTADARLKGKARALAAAFWKTLGAAPEEFAFVARIGEPRPRLHRVRSVRLPLEALIEDA
jgi:nitroreductase